MKNHEKWRTHCEKGSETMWYTVKLWELRGLCLVENNCNLIVAKMFLTYTIITEKVFRDLRFNLLCYMYIFFIELFWSKKIKWNTFLLVLRRKSIFCEHYFLPQMENIGSITRYSHTFHFRDCFVFHLMLFLEGFLVLSDLLKPAFEKKSSKDKS